MLTFESIADAASASIGRECCLCTQFYAPDYSSPATLVGGARYRRASKSEIDARNAPQAVYFRSADRRLPDGTTSSTLGGYWLLNELDVTPEMCGAHPGVSYCGAAIQAAIDYAGRVRLTPSVYDIQSAIILGRNYLGIEGSGIGRSVIVNEGTGNAIELRPLSGSTKFSMSLRDFSVHGSESSGDGLYLLNVARCIVERVESRGHGGNGLNAEAAISCRFRDYIGELNGGAGARIASGIWSGAEYRSNQNVLTGGVLNQNAAGVSIERSNGNIVHTSDMSANSNGVVISGGSGNVIDADWLENNTTDAVVTEQNVGATTVNSDRNRIVNILTSGTGDVTIANGTRNFLFGNIIVGDLTISGGASTPATYVGRQTLLSGTYSDGGSSTVNANS